MAIDPERVLSDTHRRAQTIAAMKSGADVIVQARLADGDLAGYADILLRVDAPSDLGGWSYEVQDTKLARDTKAGAILQLAAYADLVSRIQGRVPDRFHVVTPVRTESYRTGDYAAYYRMVLGELRREAAEGYERVTAEYYPEPVEQCAFCRWQRRCEARRRRDDHLCFIAGTGRNQRLELTDQGYPTLTSVAGITVPVAFKPSRGSRDTYDRISHQARVQHQQRTEGRPIVEQLPVVAGTGLCRLPEPSPGDIFLDLEGAMFAREGGREYLFGIWTAGGYRAWWATNDAEERRAFEEVMDAIDEAWTRDPGLHVYHFNHYEPTAFKRLAGRYVTRVEALSELLRAERFVDLYPIVRQSLRAGVESYSIKRLEQYYGYERRVELRDASQPLLAVEMALESGVPEAIDPAMAAVVQGYNEDDCRSTEGLRDWLERLRAASVAAGETMTRPAPKSGEPAPHISDLQQRANDLRARLLDGLPADAASSSHPQHGRWLLAYLVDFHNREENASWWEYYRLIETPVEDLFEEPDAIAGLTFVERVGFLLGKRGTPTKSVIDRYSYPPQDTEIGASGSLLARDGKAFGDIEAHDRMARHIAIRKGPTRAELHPTEVFSADVISTKTLQESVMRLAERVLAGTEECGMQLLQRERPRLLSGKFGTGDGEPSESRALRTVTVLDRTALAVQGPPGAGKTHLGAEMIRALVRDGRKVGVTSNSHKVIRNLLEEVAAQAAKCGEDVRMAAKVTEARDDGDWLREIAGNGDALTAIANRELHVLGGTSWLWARPEFAGAVDVLFVDEAGQLSLASALAVSQAANSLVLLGDPQQLGQPLKASHPDGVGISALEHVLAGHATLAAGSGIFLPTTWRMSPALTAFTSEVFYDGQLRAEPHLAAQGLTEAGPFDGSHLWLVPVDHDGNTNVSIQEVDAIDALVGQLLRSRWIDENGRERPVTPDDIRIVAPFNAQVNRLTERLGPLGVPVGTVDKFQGQTAAVVIYSLTTSRPEDAPHGPEFLYSLNRLNVATSRGRCAVFLVCSPRLLVPECRTPKQMALVNALCRYREMARTTPRG